MKRYLLKLSGEALAGEQKKGFDDPTVVKVAKQISQLSKEGTQLGIVIGGGNFWRGRTSEHMSRVKADQIGMMATIMNCIYVADSLRREGVATAIYTPFVCGGFTKVFQYDEVISDLESGKVVFFAGGTGHPYFSTDTATVLRAIEIEADGILLGKSIDGVYDKDPAKYTDAKRYDTISIQEVIDKDLQVVDATASILCRDNHMEMLVFALEEEDSILKVVSGDFKGTRVTI